MQRLSFLLRLPKFIVKMPFYAVAKGRKVGIYETWEGCKAQVDKFSGPVYKKFKDRTEAENFLKENGVTAPVHNIRNESLTMSANRESVPFVDYWPDDVSDGEEDNFLLAQVAAQFDPVANESDRKRKLNGTDNLNDLMKKMRKDSIVHEKADHKWFDGQYFPVDAEGYVLVYTDGSCENNGKPNAIAGLGVYFEDNHPLNLAQPVTGRPTNNAGEIQAAYQAIQIADRYKIDKLCINTDSQFLINSITTWIRSWKRKNWKLSNGAPVKNVVDFQNLDKLISDSKIQIRWNYVKGHAGIKGNEEADRLAREGGVLYSISKK